MIIHSLPSFYINTFVIILAAPVRFELTMSESESDALPLGYGAITSIYYHKKPYLTRKISFYKLIIESNLFKYSISENSPI